MAHVVGVPRQDPCNICKLPVFLAERMFVDKRTYHRTCLKCARCHTQLTPGNFYETEIDNEFCCETCPDEVEAVNVQPVEFMRGYNKDGITENIVRKSVRKRLELLKKMDESEKMDAELKTNSVENGATHKFSNALTIFLQNTLEETSPTEEVEILNEPMPAPRHTNLETNSEKLLTDTKVNMNELDKKIFNNDEQYQSKEINEIEIPTSEKLELENSPVVDIDNNDHNEKLSKKDTVSEEVHCDIEEEHEVSNKTEQEILLDEDQQELKISNKTNVETSIVEDQADSIKLDKFVAEKREDPKIEAEKQEENKILIESQQEISLAEEQDDVVLRSLDINGVLEKNDTSDRLSIVRQRLQQFEVKKETSPKDIQNKRAEEISEDSHNERTEASAVAANSVENVDVPESMQAVSDTKHNEEHDIAEAEPIPTTTKRITTAGKVNITEYPEEFNPFKSDDEDEVNEVVVPRKENKNLNPFDSSDDEIELEKITKRISKVPPPRPPPPRISHNPFEDDASSDHSFSRESSLSSSLSKKTPVPTPRQIM